MNMKSMALSHETTEPAAGLGGDDDSSSVFSVDSNDSGDSMPAVETTTIPLWQMSIPAQFSMARGRKNIYMRDLSDHETLEIYRDAVIVDYQGPWIRLLQICPGTFAQPVRCKLIKRPLWDAGEYYALSYSWGENQNYQEIYMESQNTPANPFPVSTHLWNALRRLRHEQLMVIIWVDAICIDQQNDVERAGQVNIMAQIFNQASEVRVWLGEPDGLENADITDAKLFWSLCQQPSPWWTRLWIVQECAYAEKCPVVMFGAQVMSFEKLIERWQSAIRPNGGSDIERRDILAANFQLLRTPFDIWTTQEQGNGHMLPLSQRLREMAGRKCTEPHDKIYALLSLIDENEAKQLRPDYRKPFPELVLEVADVLRASPGWDETRDSDLFSLLGPGSLVLTALSYDKSPHEYFDALEKAMLYGNKKVTDALIRKCVQIGTRRRHGGIALVIASEKGFADVAQMLIDAGLDVNAEAGNRGNVLYAASRGGHEKLVKMLLNAGAEVNARGESCETALCVASSEGHEKVVQMLLDGGADVNDDNALQAASHRGHEKVVKMLMDVLADVDAHERQYVKALRAASARGYEKVVQMLLDSGADVNDHDALQAASEGGHEKVVKTLIDARTDVNAQGERYSSALYVASSEGHEKVVKILLDGGADVNAQEGWFYSNALQAASANGCRKVVQMLLRRGADVNAQGGYYGNALQAASTNGYEKVVTMLLKSGTDVNAQGGGFGSALYAASSQGFERVVEILLGHGADANAQGGSFGSALYVASSKGYENIVRILLRHGADANAQGGHYSNALYTASSQGYEKIAQMLLEGGADIDAQGGYYSNALQAASAKGHEMVVQMLLKHYRNALQAASSSGNKKVVQMLMEHGADLNTQ